MLVLMSSRRTRGSLSRPKWDPLRLVITKGRVGVETQRLRDSHTSKFFITRERGGYTISKIGCTSSDSYNPWVSGGKVEDEYLSPR